jgi:predicted  nucleic acid-binding Zn-ribbon protein
MSELQPLLDYQEIDLEIKKINREISKSPDLIRFEQTKREYNIAKKTVSDNEETASKIVGFYQSVEKSFSEAVIRIDELLAALSSHKADDEDERAKIVSEIESIYGKLSSSEKRLGDNKRRAEEVIADSTKARKKQGELHALGQKYKDLATEFKKEREPKISELQKKLADMRSKIDPKLFERYERLTADNKNPAACEASIRDGGKSYFCYCGIQLSQVAQTELTKSGLCTCGQCGRIVFIK